MNSRKTVKKHTTIVNTCQTDSKSATNTRKTGGKVVTKTATNTRKTGGKVVTKTATNTRKTGGEAQDPKVGFQELESNYHTIVNNIPNQNPFKAHKVHTVISEFISKLKDDYGEDPLVIPKNMTATLDVFRSDPTSNIELFLRKILPLYSTYFNAQTEIRSINQYNQSFDWDEHVLPLLNNFKKMIEFSNIDHFFKHAAETWNTNTSKISKIQGNTDKIMAALNNRKLKYDTFISLPNQPFLRKFINELAAVQYSIQKFTHCKMLDQLLSILTNFVQNNKCQSLMGVSTDFMNGLKNFESRKPTITAVFSVKYNYTIEKLKFVVSGMNKICPNNFKNFLKDSKESNVKSVLISAKTSLTSAFSDIDTISYRNVLFSILVDNNEQNYPNRYAKVYGAGDRDDFYHNRNYRSDITDNDVYVYVFSGDNLKNSLSTKPGNYIFTIDYETERELLRELNHLK